jgi:hypothetical protein
MRFQVILPKSVHKELSRLLDEITAVAPRKRAFEVRLRIGN